MDRIEILDKDDRIVAVIEDGTLYEAQYVNGEIILKERKVKPGGVECKDLLERSCEIRLYST